MKKSWALTQDSFDHLLAWLDPDRDRAGRKYEDIRQRLIKIFVCRGCAQAEELADETINRVVRKVPDIAADYQGDPALYFYGVAQKIQFEYNRRDWPQTAARDIDTQTVPAPAFTPTADDDRAFECLEGCLDQLAEENRRLVVEYYQEEKRSKIDYRKRLAAELGIAVNALRIRAHRIRRALQECVEHCVAAREAVH